ncbi:hypothetical protein [Caballeronia calidae]|uniref:hypothetical protein n=1 Tax=Caballeronia calidae TaxID=1777139 RepID=UPI0012FE0BA3|nr:hypothetical protein [Caballeronia calidae]
MKVREARRQRVRNLHADRHLHRDTQLVGRGSLIREKIEKQGRRVDVPLTRAAILKEVINRFEMRNSRLLDTPRNSRTALQSPVFGLTDRRNQIGDTRAQFRFTACNQRAHHFGFLARLFRQAIAPFQ